MKRGVLLVGSALVGTAAVVLLTPILMRNHHHHPTHHLHLRAIADGAISYYENEWAGPDGMPLPTDLPASVGPTPAGPICGAAAPTSDAGWRVLRYQPPVEMRSTYTRLSKSVFVVRINGDLDCDGVESTFERRCEHVEDRFDCSHFEANPEE